MIDPFETLPILNQFRDHGVILESTDPESARVIRQLIMLVCSYERNLHKTVEYMGKEAYDEMVRKITDMESDYFKGPISFKGEE